MPLDVTLEEAETDACFFVGPLTRREWNHITKYIAGPRINRVLRAKHPELEPGVEEVAALTRRKRPRGSLSSRHREGFGRSPWQG